MCHSVHRGGSLTGRGVSLRGVSVREIPHTVTCGRYASYWNAFLFPVLTGMSCVSMITAGTCRADRFSLMLVFTCFTSSCVSGVSGTILRKRMTRSSDPSLLLCEMHRLSTTSLIDSTVKTNNLQYHIGKNRSPDTFTFTVWGLERMSSSSNLPT